MQYQFTDPKFASAVERHRTMLNNLQATLDDLAVARAGLEASINECDDPATKAKLYKDVVALANMTTKTSREIVDLQFRMNEVLGKDVLLRVGRQMGQALVPILDLYVNEATRNAIVDEFVPHMASIVAEATN
jgi:hypothetical protein